MQNTQRADTTSATPGDRQATTPWARYLLLGALALLLVWLGLKAWAIGGAVSSLLETRTQATAMLDAGITNVDPDEAEAMVLDVRSDVLTLKNETAFLMPLLTRLGWVPRYGALLAAAPHFVEMADAGTETAAYAVRGLKPALVVLQSDGGSERIPAIVQVIADARPDLAQAAAALERVAAARTALQNVDAMPDRVQSLLALADDYLPLAQDGLAFAQVLPQFMGSDGPRRYLIMAQNEDEIRPTGGFITGGGMLVVENGRILSLDFKDSYQVDNFRQKPYEAPPEQLESLMGFELFLFRDTNFWPDFPTSAEVAMASYSYGQDAPELDGAIAIDQRFLELLLRGIGPVSIPDTDVTLNSGNVIQTLRDSWSREDGEDVRGWLGQRKSFFGSFATAILDKVQADFGSVNPVQLTTSLFTAIDTKRLQIYARDPAVAAVLDDLNWDGRLENAAGQDFLAVVDTNVGFNKTNVYVQREIAYDVMLNADGGGAAAVALSYSHDGPQTLETCIQTTPTYEDPTYLGVANSCYWNYVRLYAPAGSTLNDSTATRFTATEMFRQEAWQQQAQPVTDVDGFATFANLLMVPQSDTRTFDFAYQLPTAVTQAVENGTRYQLQLRKQAGLEAVPVVVSVTVPPDATIVEYSPASATIDGTRVQFVLNLTEDETISVTYR